MYRCQACCPVYPRPLQSILRLEEDVDGLAIFEASPEGASLPIAVSGYLAFVQSKKRAVDLPVLQTAATAVGRVTPRRARRRARRKRSRSAHHPIRRW